LFLRYSTSHYVVSLLLKMAPLNWLHTISYWHSIATMALSCIVSKIKGDIGQTVIFSYTICIWMNFAIVFHVEKLEWWWGYHGGQKFENVFSNKRLRICLAISIQYMNATDITTDRHRTTVMWDMRIGRYQPGPRACGRRHRVLGLFRGTGHTMHTSHSKNITEWYVCPSKVCF